MQPRLTRSSNEKIIAGVCGGLGDYFHIDPVIVRLIFVLVTLTSGFGPPVYIILWVVMPRPTTPDGNYHNLFQQGVQQQTPHQQQTHAASYAPLPAEQQASREVWVAQPQPQFQQRVAQHGTYAPPPSMAGWPPANMPENQPVQPDSPATGQTIKLSPEQAQVPLPYASPADAPPRQGRNWRSLGIILVGIGGLILLEEITGSSIAFVFPALLILAGLVLLGRGRTR